jgi:hypothetical protein
MEFLYSLLGYRKKGAYDRVDDRDLPLSANLPALPQWPLDGGVDGKDAHGIHHQDQGTTPHCVGFGTAGVASHAATAIAGREITFEGEYIWSLMVKHGYVLPGQYGAYLRDGVHAVIKECKLHGGIYATDGTKWCFDKFELVEKLQFDEVISKNYRIIGGGMVNSPMCDKNWFWIPPGYGRGGGHCWQYVDDYGDKYSCDNSWKWWGLFYRNKRKRSGIFWVDKNDKSRLFASAFILTGCKKVQ